MIKRPGVWQRAGASAVLVGLDLSQALASLPRCDPDLAREFLIVAEAHFIGGVIAREKIEKGKRDGE